MEGRNWRTTQPHSDMFKGEAVGHRADGTRTLGEDPLVPFEIKHEVDEHLHGSRAGIEGAITSGVALRDQKKLRAELTDKLADVRKSLDAMKPLRRASEPCTIRIERETKVFE
jgi:hypothetical protein